MLRHTTPNTVHIDLERLYGITESTHDRQQLLRLFFRLAAELLGTMESSVANGAYKQWKTAAHSLKGSAANLGMPVLEDLCAQAEKSTDWGMAKQRLMVERLRHEVFNIRQQLTLHDAALMET